MLPCKLCYTLDGIDAEFGTLHDRKTHAQLHAFQSGYFSEDGEQMSVRKVFGQCFPLENFFEKPMEPMEPAEKTKEVNKSRSVLMEICKRIIAEKKNESNSIECQLCKSNVRYCVRSNGVHNLMTRLILTHGCHHSTKKPFVCRQCQRETTDVSNMVRHVKNCHKIDSPVNGVHFDENWVACFDEVKETLTKCFGVVDLDPDLSQLPLTAQRRSMFSNALKNTDDARKIRCDQCQREIGAKCTAQLEQHVHFHLHRGIYKCTKCDVSLPYKCNITAHLAKQHGIPSPVHPSNYIDRSDAHHEEILDCLKKCFGKEDSK